MRGAVEPFCHTHGGIPRASSIAGSFVPDYSPTGGQYGPFAPLLCVEMTVAQILNCVITVC